MTAQRRPVLAYFIASAIAVAIGFALTTLRAPPLAPAVEMRTLEGERLDFAGLREQVVLVSFWATDCTVCLQEMPAMVDLYRRFRSRGMEAIFVAMPHDRPDRVLHYARARSLPFKVVLDVQGEIGRAFGDVRATPATFLIDKGGHVVAHILGAADFEQLARLIASKLDEAV